MSIKRARSSGRSHRIAVYENPRLYDLAFSFRDIEDQCDGVLGIAGKHRAARPRSVVELACGPGHHLREFARRGLLAFGIDASAEMLAYAKDLSDRDGVDVSLQRADIRAYRLPAPVDLAICLFDSFSHCTTDADGIAALQATASNLKARGILLLELAHPADFFDRVHKRTKGRWTVRRPGVVVSARFDVERLDAVDETYIATMTIAAKYRDARPARRVVSRQVQRMWLRSGVANIAERSGAFDVVGWYGDLAPHVPFSMGPNAWRMVGVLQKR